MKKQRGVVAIIVGICIFVLVGFAGIVADLGHLFIIKTELQNGMDSCALAASRELTGVNANQLQRAENAGISVGNVNKVDYQGPNIALIPTDVTFSDTLDGTYQTRTAVEAGGLDEIKSMKYVKCELPRNNIPTYFMHLLGVGPTASAAKAKATLQPSQTSCAIPVMLCEKASTAPFGFTKGEWLETVQEPGPDGNSVQGAFRWADFTPPGGGANELKNLLGGTGQCDLPPTGATCPKGGQPPEGCIAEAGEKNGATAAWNSRFGVYGGSFSAANNPPDFTGYGYTAAPYPASPQVWPEKFNAYNGTSSSGNPNFVTARGNHTPYQGDAATGLKNTGTPSSQATHIASGANRRIALVPIVDCAGIGGGNEVPIKAYACILMLHPMNQGETSDPTPVWLEYLGLSTDSDSPCATTGLPGSSDSAGPKVPALVQ